MDEEDDEQQSQDYAFSDIVHSSLADVGRPLRHRMLDWVITAALIILIGLVVSIVAGACVIVWLFAFSKF